MKKHRFAILPAILLSALLAAGCAATGSASFPDESDYSSEILELGSVNRFAGVVTTSGETKIEKNASQTVSHIAVSAGDTVTVGQVLFSYDGTEAQNNYDKAAIELEQLRLSQNSYMSQKAELQSEKAYAGADEQLAYTVQIQELDTTIRETAYNISLKEKEVEKLGADLSSLDVKAPSDGKIQSINPDGGTDASGNPLPFMVLVRTNAYQVQALINEENIYDLSVGNPVIVRSRTSEQIWSGHVSEIAFDSPAQSQSGGYDSFSTDSSSSTKYPVYVELDSSDGLMLGQHVFIEPGEGTYEEPAAAEAESEENK